MTSNNVWEAGNFARIAPGALIVSEVLCDAIPVYAGDAVLDIGCGTGNAALAAARRRAIVAAVDPVELLLTQARERTRFEGFEIDYRHAPAEALPFADASFDIALSTFGLIFSDHPVQAVQEAARVLRPGGVLGLTSWAAKSTTFKIFEICAAARPELRSIEVGRQWGNENFAVEHLSPSFASVQITPRMFYPRAMSVELWLAGMKQFLAPVYLAYEGASPALAADLDTRLLALGHAGNHCPKPGFFGKVEYLEIVCRKA